MQHDKLRHCRRWAACVLGLAFGVPVAAWSQGAAEPFPSKVIVLINPLAAGGPQETETRLYAQKIMENTGWKVVVDFRAGAGGTLGLAYVAKAAPDGHTVLTSSSSFVMTPALYPNLPFDPIKDLAPVSLINTKGNMLVVSTLLPVKTVTEYIAYARANPGAINFATSGAGGAVHLPGAWLHNMTNTQATFIHYKGTGPLLPDLVAGRVHATYAFPVVTMPFVKAGKLRALGVTSAERIKNLPDIPAVQEQVPGFDFTSWLGAFVPSKTPPVIINRLAVEFARMAKDPEIIRKLSDDHYYVAVGSTPEQFRQYIAPQFDFWRKLVRDNGIKLEE